jgi:hypothetical protein
MSAARPSISVPICVVVAGPHPGLSVSGLLTPQHWRLDFLARAGVTPRVSWSILPDHRGQDQPIDKSVAASLSR